MKTMHYALVLLSFFAVSIVQPVLSQRQHQEITHYLSEYRLDLGLTEADAKNWTVYNEHTEENFGITYKYLRQQYDGIDVYNAVATFAEVDGRIMLSGNNLQSDIASRVNSTDPVLSSEEALRRGIRQLGLKEPAYFELLDCSDEHHCRFSGGALSKAEIPVELMLFPTSTGEIRLVWDFSIYPETAHWWSVRVDALTGELLDQVDWVTSCTFEGCHKSGSHSHAGQTVRLSDEQFMFPMPPPSTDQYRVYALPTESPNHGPRSLVVGPSDAMASPYGWHDADGVAGNEYTDTRGNNVFASEDMNDNDGLGQTADGGAALNFDFALNLAQQPSNYLDPAITNLFYMNNMMHDIWYHYGFDEASGNFQDNNYGNGGVASDAVFADAQDGGGVNNANFATPADGQNPRMQMYIWTSSTPQLLTINSPAGVAGTYGAEEANFGPAVPATPITADLAIFNDNTGGDVYDACEAATNGASLTGKIVVIRRGSCAFVDKVVRAESEGALAVIMVNNVGGAPFAMGGTDPGIGIPSVMISNVDGAALIAAIESGTVNGTLVNQGSYDLDGDLDNGIIAHEYGHGISKRLTGGASNANCLTNSEQMGEGWSDWFALMLTIEPGDQATDNRGMGTYVTGESTSGVGIRPAPYNTDFAVNNYTYAATNNTGSISQPHGIGFVWCTMLWDMTWALIDQYGFDPDLHNGTGGNNMAMHLVINALKLQPCSPGFVDGRDAILQADQLLYGGANQCLLWNAFANRGLGYSANQGSANSRSDQVEAFDIPPGMVNVSGSESVSSCGSYLWPADGNTYSSSGTYSTMLLSSTGCDSLATLNLTISAPTSGSENVTSCTNYTWPATGTTYTSSGNYTTTLTNAAGCDSTAMLNLTISNAYNVTENVTACTSYTWPATGQTYSSAGTYTANLTSINGCDSTVTLNLAISTVATTSQNVSACSSYTWPTNGNTYTTSGTYSVQLTASSGCDSIVTLNLVINTPTSGSETVATCDSYTWPTNGQTYTSSGTYSATLTNAAGCDSTATLNLVITNSSNNPTQVVTSCDSYTWAADGNTYATSGTYYANLMNSSGCDSNLVLDLTIAASNSGTEDVTSCDSYIWAANGQTYTSSGSYTAMLTNASGCDSAATLNLTINTVDNGVSFLDVVTLTADQAGASYQWLDCDNNYAPMAGATSQTFAPTVNGNYACLVSYNGCTDTSACQQIDKLGILENDFGDALSIHPNPTQGDLFVQLGQTLTSVNARLYAVNGQLVRERSYVNTNGFVFTVDAAPGYYILELQTSDDRKARIKVLKE